jgi:hypothetical protein
MLASGHRRLVNSPGEVRQFTGLHRMSAWYCPDAEHWLHGQVFVS